MKHIVLFKFKETPQKNILEKLVDEVYSRLKDEFKVIKGYEFRFNCIQELEQNMDLVLFVDLEGEDSLSGYIGHPVHVQFVDRLKDMELSQKSAIDIIQ